MKFTFSWLRDHLDTEGSLDEIAHALTMLGLEVDSVHDRGRELAPFKVARVLSAEQHPNADRLRVCMVDTGEEHVQVVCGAPNARTGMMGVFAPAGVTVPGTGLYLKKSKIRGVESNGMLVSERELGLSDEHEGIIDLPEDAPLGAPFARVAGLDDPVIDVGLTPNRGDCAGVRGIARDLAAGGYGSLKRVHHWGDKVAGAFESPIKVHLEFPAEAGDACPMFVGRYIRGIKNGPSPRWLRERLKAVGLRPISALVDITNYFSLDLGRPLHVFDADRLTGDIVVRLARSGERLLALDGREYELDDQVTVVADGAGPQGLGGVIGGEASGCTEETTNVYLECALFDPQRTAATGRKLGIVSDARYRFERGVDPTAVLPSMEAATNMILELCGGEPSEPVIAGGEPEWRREVVLRPERVTQLGGVEVSADESAEILHALGFVVEESEGKLKVMPPPWRPDVHGEADLVEEVLRVFGYDRIPVVPLERESTLPPPPLSTEQSRPVKARRVLAVRGLAEAKTFSFLSREQAVRFAGGATEMRLVNPISADLDTMRPSVLPNLLDAARRNGDRGLADAGLFEVGPQFANASPGGQSLVAAGVRWGRSGPRHWSEAPRAVDAFDAKADAIAVLEACGAPVSGLQAAPSAPDWYHPGRSGSLRLGETVLAFFGEVHPTTAATYDLDAPVIAFEVFLDALPAPKKGAGKSRSALQLSPYQAVSRDFAFVVERNVPAQTIVRAARGAERELIADVSVFDVYSGPGLDAGSKSVAIAVVLQPTAATLTDAEIEAASTKIVQAVEKATGGRLRG